MRKRALQPHFAAVVLSYHRTRRHFSVTMLIDCIKGLRAGGSASVRLAMSVELFWVTGLMNETGGDNTETLFEGATLRLGLISAVHLSNDPLHHCNEATIVLL